MGLSINHNSAALNAQRRMSATSDALGKSIERLSSGYKINNAGDDPAGLVISEKLRAQIGGLNQAIKNAGDAVNMVKTAEGALTEVNRLLGNIRTLAVHAANTGANDQATTRRRPGADHFVTRIHQQDRFRNPVRWKEAS